MRNESIAMERVNGDETRPPLLDVKMEGSYYSYYHHRGKLDLVRRYLLSAIKPLCYFSALNAILVSFQTVTLKQNSSNAYNLNSVLGGFFGGFIEPVLACYPHTNQKWLPRWAALCQFIENYLAKIMSLMIYICPLQNIGAGKFLPDFRCVRDNQDYILYIFSVPFFIMGVFGSYMEYRKYPSDTLQTNLLFFDTSKLTFRILFSTINSAIAVMSLNSALDYSLPTMLRSQRLSIPFTLSSIGIAGALSGAVEYFDEVNGAASPAKKVVYAISEFLRPTLGNWLAVVILFFSSNYYYDNANGDADTIDRSAELIVVSIFLPIMNIIRAHDSYRYKFVKPTQPITDAPVTNRERASESTEMSCCTKISRLLSRYSICCLPKEDITQPLLSKQSSQVTAVVDSSSQRVAFS